jgi:hypothetical protein
MRIVSSVGALWLCLALICALPLTAQTNEPAKATISNVGTEPAPYIPADEPKPLDNYSAAFVTKPVTPRTEQTTSFAPTRATNDHHIWKNIGKGLLFGAGVAGVAILNTESCSLYASRYSFFWRAAAYHACLGY